MNIAIDISQIVYKGTGVARYTEELVKHILQIDTKNKYTLYAGAIHTRNILKQYKNKIPWNTANWKLSFLSPKIADIAFNRLNLSIDPLIGSGIDIFHSSDWTQPKTKAIAVTTVHDLVFERYPETLDPVIVSTQKQRMNNIVKQQVHIIADSMSTKHDLMKIYNIPSDRISTVYLACSDAFTPQSTKEINRVKKKYNITTDYILSLGTKEPRKNLKRVIDAFRAYKKTAKNKNISLVISGKYGWGDEVLSNDPDIIQTGFVDDSDLPSLYSGAKVFLYPSLYEGFGLPVLEAMSCGTPVVTSNTSSLPEIVGDAGVLVTPTNTKDIRDGIVKAFLRNAVLSKKSLKQSKKFSWKKTAGQTLAIYEYLYNRQHMSKTRKTKR